MNSIITRHHDASLLSQRPVRLQSMHSFCSCKKAFLLDCFIRFLMYRTGGAQPDLCVTSRGSNQVAQKFRFTVLTTPCQVLEARHDVQNAAKAGDVAQLRDAQKRLGDRKDIARGARAEYDQKDKEGDQVKAKARLLEKRARVSFNTSLFLRVAPEMNLDA